MKEAEAISFLADARLTHVALVGPSGEPILRTYNAVWALGAVAFHAAPAGEKMEGLGRPAVASVEEVVASIPSYFLDPERACPATTLYRSVQVHGVLEEVTDVAEKARVLSAIMAKYQPEGGHVPISAEHPLYAKVVAGLLVARIVPRQLDGKAKLGQNRTPAERVRLCEKLWERGGEGDAVAIERILEANPSTAVPGFLAGPKGTRLVCAPGPRDAEAAATMLDGLYWNGPFSKAELVRAHAGSQAWVGARDEDGVLVASARAVSDNTKHAWIYDVVVAPERRGQGLGGAVVRLLLSHPAVRGARFVHLGTRDAHGLYRKFGFVDEGEMPKKSYVSTIMHLVRNAGFGPSQSGKATGIHGEDEPLTRRDCPLA